MKNKTLIILTLGVLSAVGPFSIDMYLPAFPAMASNLNTDISQIQLSLSSYFIGISLGQLIYGPIIDRFGRLIPLFVGLFIYLITSIICAYTATVDTLITMRFFQALGGCAGMVISRAMVRDIFPVNENARIFSLLMLVIGVSPILAPTLGGYASSHFGWRSIFLFLVLLAVFTLILCYKYLPESKPADKSISLKPINVLKDFKNVLIEPQFIFYALAGGLASAGLFAYIAGASFVFIDLFDVTDTQFGWIFGLNATGLVIASQVNRQLLKNTSSERIIMMVSIVQVLAGLILFFLSIINELNIYNTISLLFIFLSAQGFFFPNTSALAMAPFNKRAGIASALLGSLQMIFSAASSFAVSYFHNNTAIPITAIIAICVISSFILIFIGERYKKKLSL
jgi:DHA1 family bicyclomycin/chloramphenicol resistance-like MFS transporter